MSTALTTPAAITATCSNCDSLIESMAKFCGDCGEITEFGSGVFQAIYETRAVPEYSAQLPEPAINAPSDNEASQVSYHELALLESYRLANRSGQEMEWAPTPTPTNNQGRVIEHNNERVAAPRFAREGKAQAKRTQLPESLVREMQSLNALLLRERIFLGIHWTIFVTANLIGFYLASKCYAGFVGDEVTRFIMALTPLTFINAVALACLAPIRGTRREIARVKERMQYLKVQLDYGNLI
ncbi:hypothetical protein GC174_13490 [bacterium]|nr:hypothetical protein [bacterium]